MFQWMRNKSTRRHQVREQRVRENREERLELLQRFVTLPALLCAGFVIAVVVLAITAEPTVEYAPGQRVEQPVYARVPFTVANPEQTEANRSAARAATPSIYRRNAAAVTTDKIRADLMRLYQVGADAPTAEAFAEAMGPLKLQASAEAYEHIRRLAGMEGDAGRKQFQQWVDALPLDEEFVVRGFMTEKRVPPTTADYLILEEGPEKYRRIAFGQIASQENDKAIRGIALGLAYHFPHNLRPMVEQVVAQTLRAEPTIVFDADKTLAAMQQAESAVAAATVTYEADKPFIAPSVLGSEQVALLNAHHAAYLAYLEGTGTEAEALRLERRLQQIGLCAVMTALSLGLLIYVRSNHPRLFDNHKQLLRLLVLCLATLVAVRILHMQWANLPMLVLIPVLLTASILPIVHQRRFAIGVSCILVVIVAALIGADQALFLTMLLGAAVSTYQLNEIRSRTKLIRAGAVTAVVTTAIAASTRFVESYDTTYVIPYALWSGACAMGAAFILSGVLPFVESTFRVASSLTLLEWRDPTRTLLQRLAEEAQGTYNHSLVLGNLAQAACERIGCNGLLAQVGALYHDIGKVLKPDYFTENQTGRINRHDRLSPSMSLLIILAHVKDGLEMAREYKLPRVLHQFIAEHHGTTVVRFFHHMASEKQPRIASGRHDREVSEAEFRYPGPKPQSKESAVVMICDGVEGAVRAQSDPTPGRIEGVVHQIISDRLHDGQFDECDITLRELHQVEDSLVKSLCGIYHGRLAYPKSRDLAEEPTREIAQAGG